MRKGSLFILLFLLITSNLHADQIIQELFFSKIRSIKEDYYSFEEKFGVWTKTEQAEPAMYLFNENGQLYEISIYNMFGELVSKTMYNYNNVGLLVEINEYSNVGILLQKNILLYNDLNNVYEVKSFNMDGTLLRIYKIEYSDEYIIVFDLMENQPDFPFKKTVYKFNSNGFLIEETIYSPNERRWEKSYTLFYEYKERDERGNWILKSTSIEESKFGMTYIRPISDERRTITY